jgi:hypothetical protein
MLPDYPALKADLMVAVNRFLRDRIAYHSGFMEGMPVHVLHEGGHESAHTLTRADGTSDTGLHEIRSTMSIANDKLLKLTWSEIESLIDDTAADIAGQQARLAIQKLEHAARESGTAVDAKGQGFSPELFLETWAGMDIEFERNGTPIWPTVICSPEGYEAAQGALRKLFESGDYEARLRALIVTKLEDFRARKANRNLVR